MLSIYTGRSVLLSFLILLYTLPPIRSDYCYNIEIYMYTDQK